MGFSKILLIIVFVTSIYAIPTNLEANNDITTSKSNEIKDKEPQVSIPCINRKEVLGEGEKRENDDIDCIPLTGPDKGSVLRVKNDLAAFSAIEDKANAAKKSIITELNEGQTKKPLIKEDGLKLEEEELSEVNQDHLGLFTEDLSEGSGQIVEENNSGTDKSPNFMDELDANMTNFQQHNPIFPNSKEPSQAAAAIQKTVSTGGFSSVFAGWAAGFFGTFTLVAIGAMCAKSRERKRQKMVKLSNGISEKYEAIEMT